MYTDLNLEELKESEARFHATFNQAAVGIAHVTIAGTLIRVNQKFCEIVGYESDELLHMSFQEITYPEDLADDMDYIDHLIDGQLNTYTMEKRYIRKDGSLIWVELTVSILRLPDRPAYFISVVKDINSRKAAQEALQSAHLELEKRVKLRTSELSLANRFLKLEMRERQQAQLERDNFFDLAHDIMAISDSRGYFRRVNPAFCQLLGYTSAELTSKRFYDFMHPEDRERSYAYRKFIIEGASNEYAFENRFIAKDGSVKWLSWSGRTLSGLGLNYSTARDITDRKAQEFLAEQNQIVMATNSKLNAIGLMAANMAHEINNPLTIIYGEGCLLKQMTEQGKADESKLSRIAGNVVKMSERIVKIVNGLRTLARDGSPDPMKTVPLHQIFDETIPFCRGKIVSEGIELEVEDVPPDVFVCCRSVQLSQALLNLLNNAHDAVLETPQDRSIKVYTVLTATRVEIRVSDNGTGISHEVRDHLFQPFVSTKALGQGLGLGLSVSKNMIESNDGELFLDHEAAQTTFVISLPRVSSE